MVRVKTKTQLEEETQKLTMERDYYRRLAVDHGDTIDFLTRRCDELLKLCEVQAEELALLRKTAGERQHNERGAGRKPKLTLEVIEQVKECRAAGMTYVQISDKLSLAMGSIHKAINS